MLKQLNKFCWGLPAAKALPFAFFAGVLVPISAHAQSANTPATSGEYSIEFKDGWSSSGGQLIASSPGFANVQNINTFQFVCQSGIPKVVSGTLLIRGTGHPITGGSGSINHILLQFNLVTQPPVANFHFYRPADNAHGEWSGTVTQNGPTINASGFFDASSKDQPKHKGKGSGKGGAAPVCPAAPPPPKPPIPPITPPWTPPVNQPPGTTPPPDVPPSTPPIIPPTPPPATPTPTPLPPLPLRVPQ